MFVDIPKDIHLCKLPYLTRFSVLSESPINMEYFHKILEVSPNLYNLEVSYEFFQPVLDNELVCPLLKQRITHLYISLSFSTSLELVISSISHLTSIFPLLKHFYFRLKSRYHSAELLILTLLHSLSKWNSLVSFGVVDALITEEVLSNDIQQWVLENSTMVDCSSFIVDYTNEIFRLWL